MKIIKPILVVLLLCCMAKPPANAQANEAAQLALNIEKLAQLKSILTTLKKGFEIVSKGYTTVKSLTEGNFNLHKVFLDGLLEVSPAVKKYQKVAGIIDYQIILLKEYKSAGKRLTRPDLFNPSEITYMLGVYQNIASSSLQNLDQLLNVITAGKLRMSDDERLAAIDKIYADQEDKLDFVKAFGNSCSLMALARSKENLQVTSSSKLHGITQSDQQ